MHFPLLPLVIEFYFSSLTSFPHLERILLALQHHDRVRSISFYGWGLGNVPMTRKMLTALDNVFPNLEALSLRSGNNHTTRGLPDNFVAPRLRSLNLRNIAISATSLFLTNATNVIILQIEQFPPFGDLNPRNLVMLFSSLPQLESLSTNFSFYPTHMATWEHTQITRIVLPRLWRFKYQGHIGYLENLLALINAPLLQYFYVACFWKSTFFSPPISEVIGAIQGLDFQTAEVSINPKGVHIAFHSAQPSVSLPSFTFTFYTVHNRPDSPLMAQIYSAIPALPSVHGLVLKSNQKVCNEHWYSILQLFAGVRTLRTDISLAADLSDALRHGNGAAMKYLLPMLSELVVVSQDDLVDGPIISFVHELRLIGHHIDLRVIKEHPPPNPRLHVLHNFPVF